MAWSTEQSHHIVEQFWRNAVARCPDDNGPLKLKLHTLQGGDYELHAECQVCGQRKEFRRGDDPQRHHFRRWTPDEVRRLDRSARELNASPCPVCSALVQRHPMPGLSILRCIRCGNSDQWQQFASQTDCANVTDAPIVQPRPLSGGNYLCLT